MTQEELRPRLGLAFAIVTATLWGFLPIALKFALGFVNSATIVWFRFLFAFLVLGAMLRARNPNALRILRRPPPLGILSGLLLAANYFFYMKGLELIGANGAQILIQVSPLIFAAIGIFHFHEPLGRIQRWGFPLAILGLVLFNHDQLSSLGDGAGSETYTSGLVSIAISALAWAIWATIQKKLGARGHRPQHINLLTYVVAAIVLLPMAAPAELAGLTVGNWALLCVLGLNTILAYGALGEALRHAPANQVSMIVTLNPMLTLGAMALLEFLGADWVEPEPVTAIGYLGALTLVAGVILVVSRRRSRRRSAEE